MQPVHSHPAPCTVASGVCGSSHPECTALIHCTMHCGFRCVWIQPILMHCTHTLHYLCFFMIQMSSVALTVPVGLYRVPCNDALSSPPAHRRARGINNAPAILRNRQSQRASCIELLPKKAPKKRGLVGTTYKLRDAFLLFISEQKKSRRTWS
jgi:hypothetical protein